MRRRTRSSEASRTMSLVLIPILVLAVSAFAQADNDGIGKTNRGDLLWEDRVDASESDQAFSAAALKDRVFVAGWVSTPGTFDRDFFVRAYDTRTGTPLWQNQVHYGTDDFASAVVTDGKRVFVSGRGFVRRGDWVVRAYDAETGGLLWEDVFDLAGGDDRTQRRALLVEKGLLYVGGSAQTPFMLRVDTPADLAGLPGPAVWQRWSRPMTSPASGALVEAARVAQPDGDARGDLGCRLGDDTGLNPFPPGSLTGAVLVVDRGTCVVSQKAVNAEQAGAVGMILVMLPGQQPVEFTASGAVGIPVVSIGHMEMADLRSAVAASTEVVVTLSYAFYGVVRAYDASSGALVWQDVFDFGGLRGIRGTQARSFAVKDGRLFVGGYGVAVDTDEVVVRTYDSRTGRLLWGHNTSGLSALGYTFARRVAVLGERLFVGATVETAEGVEYLLQAYDVGSGALLWEDRGNNGGHVDFLEDIDVHGDRVFSVVDGGSGCLLDEPPTSNCDTYVRGYEAATGTLLWERQFALSEFDDLSEYVRADQGTVFLSSAAAFTSLGGRWVIQALDSSTGHVRWENVGGDLELPLGLTLHKGRLFVPGRSVDPDTDKWDFIVRAYDARPGSSTPNRSAVELKKRGSRHTSRGNVSTHRWEDRHGSHDRILPQEELWGHPRPGNPPEQP